MRRQIVASQRAGESVQRVAERLLEVDRPIVRLPEHVQDLRRAARLALETGDQNFFEGAVDRWASRIRRLGEQLPGGRVRGGFSIRSATQHLVTELRTARPEQVQHIIDRWVIDRAQFQARMVARTETVEAFRDAYRRSNTDQPYVKGYRWVLSTRHPRPDVCDILANQDLHGLGPGGYTREEVPATPHPLDLCSQVAIIDSAHMRRELARRRGDPEPPRPWEHESRETAQEWLGRIPAGTRDQLLGPTRARLFDEGRDVLDARSHPRPVHELLGRPPPTRRLGRPVNVAPLIRADRASMPEPFPAAPQLPSNDDGRRTRRRRSP